jgi:hypothetical protein
MSRYAGAFNRPATAGVEADVPDKGFSIGIKGFFNQIDHGRYFSRDPDRSRMLED